MLRAQITDPATRVPALRLLLLAVAVLLAIGPAAAGAAQPTPAAMEGPIALEAMLRRVPATLPGLDTPALAMIGFADYAAQLDAAGLPPADTIDVPEFEGWRAATRGMPLEPVALAPALDDYGFNILDVDQSLTVRLAPFSLSLYRGRIDLDAARGALETLGYRPVGVDGHELLAIRDGDPLVTPEEMAFAAILDDGTVAFASDGPQLAAVLDVATGAAPSMLENAGIRTLIDHAPPDLAAAEIANGLVLAGGHLPALVDIPPGGTPDIAAIATTIAGTVELPPVAMVLVATTTGGPLSDPDIIPPSGMPDARNVVVALMLTPEAARAAVPIVEERLATGMWERGGESYAAMFPEPSVTAVPGAPVLILDLVTGPETGVSTLPSLLRNGEMDFLAW
jgi:hypothetical protein